MSQEKTLVVFTLASKEKAEDLLKTLQNIDVEDEDIEILEAAFATRVSAGHVKMEQFNDLGAGRGAFGGGTIGVIAGTMVAGPLGAAVGGAVGAAAAGLYARLRDSGVSDHLMKEISEKLEVGQTDLFVIYSGVISDQMLNALREHDANLSYGTLPEEATAAVTEAYEETGEEVVDELEVYTAEATEADTEATEADVAPLAAASADDLTVIDGIGPKISRALNDAGITTFDQLHRASEVDVREALIRAGVVVPKSMSTWSRQAGFAAQGDWKEMYKFNAKRKLDSTKK